MSLPSTTTGPETSIRACSPMGSTAMTPSTVSPVRAFHISAASAALGGNRGDIARLRHSWLGSVQPQRSLRSPVTGTAPAGTMR